VTRDEELAAWERAWRSMSTEDSTAGAGRLFRPSLLDDPDIRFLTGTRHGSIVSVVIANRSDDGSGPVVGLSNLVLAGGDPRLHGPGAIAAVRDAFPGLPVVGYERGGDLAALLALGFESLGPLRVWLSPRGGERPADQGRS
jgi:hypothetical protein